MFVAIATPEGPHVRELHLGNRPVRARLRTQTAHHAFDLARRYVRPAFPWKTKSGRHTPPAFYLNFQ